MPPPAFTCFPQAVAICWTSGSVAVVPDRLVITPTLRGAFVGTELVALPAEAGTEVLPDVFELLLPHADATKATPTTIAAPNLRLIFVAM